MIKTDLIRFVQRWIRDFSENLVKIRVGIVSDIEIKSNITLVSGKEISFVKEEESLDFFQIPLGSLGGSSFFISSQVKKGDYVVLFACDLPVFLPLLNQLKEGVLTTQNRHEINNSVAFPFILFKNKNLLGSQETNLLVQLEKYLDEQEKIIDAVDAYSMNVTKIIDAKMPATGTAVTEAGTLKKQLESSKSTISEIKNKIKGLQ